MARSERLRRGVPVRVARQDPQKAKLAVYGYDHHEHYGDAGVVTDVRETDAGTWYVVRFDEYGWDALPYRSDELEPV
jgi:hypothetical protein